MEGYFYSSGRQDGAKRKSGGEAVATYETEIGITPLVVVKLPAESFEIGKFRRYIHDMPHI